MPIEEVKKYQKMNKKRLGFFKDEMGKDKIVSWVGLKSKSYAYMKANGGQGFRCKGISKTLFYDQFLEVLMNPTKDIKVSENKMRSHHHEVFVL